MDLLIADASVPLGSADGPPATGTPQYATDGNPATNTPATVWPSYWLNGLMRELLAIMVAGGVTPNKAVYNSLLTSLQALFAPGGNLAASGYINLPKIGALTPKLNWATYTLTPGSSTNCPAGSLWGTVAVTWNSAFPTAALGAWAAAIVTTNGQYSFASVNALTTTGVNVYHNIWNSATVPVTGVAFSIGY